MKILVGENDNVQYYHVRGHIESVLVDWPNLFFYGAHILFITSISEIYFSGSNPRTITYHISKQCPVNTYKNFEYYKQIPNDNNSRL